MDAAELDRIIGALPKAELHLHIEGTLEPELAFALAERNRVALRFASVDALRAAYAFTDLQSFLDLYYEGMRVLLHEQDFYDLAWAYFRRAAAEHVLHAEVFFDPQAHTERGVHFTTVLQGLKRAQARARDELGVTSHLICCFLRDRSAAAALTTLERAKPFLTDIAAVGLDSAERGHPPAKFAAVFAEARRHGFLAVAHAGEEGPPEYIREALDLLKVRRIDHGVRCLEDPDLVARLRREQVPLTVCPLSNLRLGVVARLEDHPLKRMLDAGLKVTVNSDDPAYFGGTLTDNLLAVRRALDLTPADVRALTVNAFEAAFLAPHERAPLVAAVNAAFGA